MYLCEMWRTAHTKSPRHLLSNCYTIVRSFDGKKKKCRSSVTLSTNHIKALRKRLQSCDLIGWKNSNQNFGTSVVLKIVRRFDGKTVDVLGLIFAKLNFLCIEFLFKACWILMYGFYNLFFSFCISFSP
jgi:hypothetical protein